MVWREDMDDKRDAACSNLEVVSDIVEILDASAENRSGILSVSDFGTTSARQLKPFRSVLIDELLLCGGKNRPGEVSGSGGP